MSSRNINELGHYQFKTDSYHVSIFINEQLSLVSTSHKIMFIQILLIMYTTITLNFQELDKHEKVTFVLKIKPSNT